MWDREEETGEGGRKRRSRRKTGKKEVEGGGEKGRNIMSSSLWKGKKYDF